MMRQAVGVLFLFVMTNVDFLAVSCSVRFAFYLSYLRVVVKLCGICSLCTVGVVCLFTSLYGLCLSDNLPLGWFVCFIYEDFFCIFSIVNNDGLT